MFSAYQWLGYFGKYPSTVSKSLLLTKNTAQVGFAILRCSRNIVRVAALGRPARLYSSTYRISLRYCDLDGTVADGGLDLNTTRERSARCHRIGKLGECIALAANQSTLFSGEWPRLPSSARQ